MYMLITMYMYMYIVHVHREKQEDLEKRQFFINRELRPLLQIPGQSEGFHTGALIEVDFPLTRMKTRFELHSQCVLRP